MPKLIGCKRKISLGEITGTTQLKRKVSRKLGFSPWTGKVGQRRQRSCVSRTGRRRSESAQSMHQGDVQ
jgi:hypothetical protein